MKISFINKKIILGLSMLLWLASCNEDVTEFGFDGSFSGTLKDEAGKIVAGDITSTGLMIKALGEGDDVTMDIRVKGDGTYGNSKLFPKRFKMWVQGPVTMTSDTLEVNLAENKTIKHDFVVTPFITIEPPASVGQPSGTEITVSYQMHGNNGNMPNLRHVYCSTVPYPNQNTGDGPFFHSKVVEVANDSGSATITGLKPGTKYFIRVGARAAGQSNFNFSDQIIVNTPGG